MKAVTIFAVLLILSTEFCERFAFYQVKSALPLFLNDHLGLSEETAVVILHSFVALAFFTPVVAGWLADSYFGRFPTIVVLAIVYILGQLARRHFSDWSPLVALQSLLTLAAILPPHASASAEIPVIVTAILGLVGTAFGTGYKPCISAMGASMVEPSNLTSYYNFFYVAINSGSFISLLISPLLTKVEGYWMSFLVPTLMMILALFIFMLGFQMYVHVKPKGKNVLFWMLSIIFAAVVHYNQYTREQSEFHDNEDDLLEENFHEDDKEPLTKDEEKALHIAAENAMLNNSSMPPVQDDEAPPQDQSEHEPSREDTISLPAQPPRNLQAASLLRKDGRLKSHFLNAAALAGYSKEDIAAVQCVIDIIKVLCVIPIYWSVFEQFSSRWVFQGKKMRQDIGPFSISPVQMQILNPICILIFVPFFDRIVYKLVKLTPLQRISIGFLFMIAAYTLSIILEVFVVTFPMKIHILAQTVQFVLLSISEVLVSVTGLEFAYAESPTQMKSLMSAFYLVCVSLGNVILVLSTLVLDKIFDGVRYRHVFEMTFFIIFLLFGFIIFVLLSLGYEYKKGTKLTAHHTKPSMDSNGNLQGEDFIFGEDEATARDADDFSFDEENSSSSSAERDL